MKRLNKNQVADAFSMPYLRKEKWQDLPFIFELKAHNQVTLDIQPVFINIAKSYKDACKTHNKKDLQVLRINNTTSRKTPEYINPEY